MRVLAMLIDRPGELVSREEIWARLWPADTYVSFDEGLNSVIRKLRVVFQDSADNPRFIQTVPRKGYRFIAPVTEIEVEKSEILEEPVSAAGDGSAPGAGKEEVQRGGSEPDRRSGRRWGVRRWLLAGLAGIAILGRGSLPGPNPDSRGVRDDARSTLVVLPFQNLSGDPAQDYFSDGLTEEAITDLGQLSPAHLRSDRPHLIDGRTNTPRRPSGKSARNSMPDYVLEGSVRRENERVRISAQLIRVSDQTHLWAKSYDARNPGDVIDLQNAIGRAIADQVQVKIAPQYQAEEARPHAQNPAAYDLYLQGRFYWNQRTPPALAQEH